MRVVYYNTHEITEVNVSAFIWANMENFIAT
jgi:hypothetical protein